MQKAILVGVNLNENLDFDHSMEELENLAEACEIEAAAQVVQNLPMVNNAFYIGTGKVEEVKNLVSMLDADCVIFDNSLTPSPTEKPAESAGGSGLGSDEPDSGNF